MASVKYGPGVVEFYAPDSFERLGELAYCTVDHAAAAPVENVLVSSCDRAYTLADSADSTAYGLAAVSRVDVVRDRIEELEDRVMNLELAIAKSEADRVVRKMSRMDKLRAELKTLCY